jgi:uncharacterized hydrophobic protein (TIGR00271 family)
MTSEFTSLDLRESLGRRLCELRHLANLPSLAAMVTSEGPPHQSMSLPFTQWWSNHVAAGVDYVRVMQQVREDSGWSNHFAFMTLMSAGIAVLGLLLSSPAVVIGAMLISPLMGPIIGLGFAIATFDALELRRSGWPLLGGIVLAVLFCALIVLVSPLQSVTGEITSRTRPNLFDLLVALFSGLAGTYAMIRGRHGTIVGVAIATALMPPLAVMGFGLATANWQVLGGSSLLFFTNLMTIAAAAAVLARLYGFAHGLSPHQSRLQAVLIIATLIALAVPLGISLRQIAWEALASREASATIASGFPKSARVNDLAVDYHARPLAISATVLTPEYRQVEDDLTRRLTNVMGRPVALSLDQLRTRDGVQSAGDSSGDAAAAAQRTARRIAEQMALVAGVPISNVIVDRSARNAIVRARPLPGATLPTYRHQEMRIASNAPGWSVNVMPPVSALADIELDLDDADEMASTLATAAWASKRLGLPVVITGGSDEQADQVAEVLRQSGAKVDVRTPLDDGGQMSLRWLVPEQSIVKHQ